MSKKKRSKQEQLQEEEEEEKHKKKVLILGAAGMDYHVFNCIFRNDSSYQVLAFSVAGSQNLGTTSSSSSSSSTRGDDHRKYPPVLSGQLYPNGIDFISESSFESFVQKHSVDIVVLAYSDLSHEQVMHLASRALAAGADYWIISPRRVQLKSTKPVFSVCAVRTGVGKSSVSRAAVRFFKSKGKRVVAVREPMPYGDLSKQVCMRFETMQDLDTHHCTIEEREEYEPYIRAGMIIYSGVDYEKILRAAESEADIILFDGGNNEVSFFHSDFLLVLADPLRRGHELTYHPGEANCRMADCFMLTKCHEASLEDIHQVEMNLRSLTRQNTTPISILHVGSETVLEDPETNEPKVRGKRVVVVEDGPTVTHGGTPYGAGFVLSKRMNAIVINPVQYAKGCYEKIFQEFPHISQCIPAMGYTETQLNDLADTLNAIPCDIIVNGSPSDLSHLIGKKLNKEIVRVFYDIAPMPYSSQSFEEILSKFLHSEHVQ